MDSPATWRKGASTVIWFGLLSARGLLAAIFLVAGLAKLSNQRASVQALRDFGLPRFVQPFAPLLPWLEIVVAAGLVFAASAWYAAWAAVALLVGFMAGISANLVRGRRPDCNCFGQVRAKPISWRTLVRNGGLAAAATWLILSGPPRAADDLGTFLSRLDTHGRRVAIVFAAAIGLVLLTVFRRQEEAAESDPFFPDEPDVPDPAGARAIDGATAAPPVRRSASGMILTGDGLTIGTAAPGFAIPDLEGHPHSLDSLRAAGIPIVLVFSSPHCESCHALLPKLPGLAALHQHAFRLVLITRGSAQQTLRHLQDPGALTVLFQQNYEIAESFNCTSSPAAVVVGADGTVQSDLAVGGAAITRLISSRWGL